MAVSRISTQSIQQGFPKGDTFWDGTTATSAFDSLGSVLLSAATSTITFSSIPQTYTHLQIRGIHRVQDNSNNVGDVYMRVGNGTVDSGNNYSNHVLVGDGTSAASAGGGSRSSVMGYDYYNSVGNLGYANTFGICIIDILDYSNTSKNKTIRILEGREMNSGNTDSRVYLESGTWNSTSAINIISFNALSGTGSASNFAAYTNFSLYGIK